MHIVSNIICINSKVGFTDCEIVSIMGPGMQLKYTSLLEIAKNIMDQWQKVNDDLSRVV